MGHGCFVESDMVVGRCLERVVKTRFQVPQMQVDFGTLRFHSGACKTEHMVAGSMVPKVSNSRFYRAFQNCWRIGDVVSGAA